MFLNKFDIGIIYGFKVEIIIIISKNLFSSSSPFFFQICYFKILVKLSLFVIFFEFALFFHFSQKIITKLGKFATKKRVTGGIVVNPTI
jgi:hypothetical protein